MPPDEALRLRSATRHDVNFLIPLVDQSSGGVWPAVWKALASDGESPEAYAARYLADPVNSLSIRNTILVESESQRLGFIICYREERIPPGEQTTPHPPPLPAELDSALEPYRELSDPNSLFIAEICCLPEARGKGLGTRLLQYANALAVDRELPSVSLRVFSENAGAVRLYDRNGFKVIAERAVVPHPDIRISGSVYLMSRPV